MVVDLETDEPISDAFVVGQWSKSGTERTICFQLDMTRSDDSGRYRLPAPRIIGGSWLEDKNLTLLAYKKGFRQRQYGSDGSYLNPGRDGVIQMEKLKGELEEPIKRIEILREVARNITCHPAGENTNNVADIYRALYEEALEYAGGKETEGLLFLREQVEQFELGYEKASERYRASLRSLMDKKKEQHAPEVRVIEHTDQTARGATRINEK
jgi:hypothetical protein